MDIEMVTSLAAAIGVIIAIFSLVKQSRDAHLSLGIQLLRDLEKQFESDEMKQFRIALSNLQLKREKGAIISSIEMLSNTDVLDFFHTVGMFVRRNLLDLEFTWELFAYWALHYWEVLEKDIFEYRKVQNDRTYWSEFEYLYKKLDKLDAKKLKIQQREFTKVELRRFLREETQLRKTPYRMKK